MSQRRFERDAEKRQTRRRRQAALATGAVGAAVLLTPSVANADPYTVGTLVDEASDGECVTDCTLREAITLANATPGNDKITFGENVRGTLTLTQGQLAVTDGLTSIQGPGPSALTIAAAPNNRILQATSDTDISGLRLTGGNPGGSGGAILAQGTDLNLTDCVITGNRSTSNSGGGVAMAQGNNNAFSTGELTLENTTVSGNQAASVGGGIDAVSELTMVDSTVSGNTAGGQGGGIAKRQGFTRAQNGAKFDFGTGPLAITDSTVAGNTSGQQGGGIAIDNSIGDEGGDASSGKYDVEILRTTVSGNTATGDGGGINFEPTIGGPSTITNSTVAGNRGADGGGIHAGGQPEQVPARATQRIETTGGSLDVDNTTVASNTATGTGGGIALDQDVEGVDPVETFRASGDDQVGLASTIVGDNTSADDNKDLASVRGTGYGSEHSLLETPADATVATTAGQPTITGQDPQLGALAANGGPTQTKLPAESSPAVDKGSSGGLTTEQRQTQRVRDLSTANAAGGDGTDIGAVEITPGPPSLPSTIPSRPVTPSSTSTPSVCGRRSISLIRADRRGSKVRLKGLVGAALYGKTVTIQTDPRGAKSSAFTKTASVKASKTGSFTATVPAPDKDDLVSVRYRARAGSSTSAALKLPQSLTSRSVKSAKGTITVTGKVKKSVLGKRNRVKIRRLVCGRYRTVGSAKPDENGTYRVTFKATEIRGVSLYRAESRVLRKEGSEKYVTQYARAIAIKTTSQTG